jgi:hypothetical protein
VKLAIAHLRSTSVYSQSKFYETEKERSETSAQYEVRTWRNRMHVDENGSVFIPPMAFKNCLSDAAKYLSILDEIVNPEVFREHLKWAGQIIGIGRFRPRNNGYYGRFKVEDVKWQEVDF